MRVENVKEIVKELKWKYPDVSFKIDYSLEDDDYTVLMSSDKVQHSDWFVEFLGKKIKDYFSRGEDFNAYFCYDSQFEELEKKKAEKAMEFILKPIETVSNHLFVSVADGKTFSKVLKVNGNTEIPIIDNSVLAA